MQRPWVGAPVGGSTHGWERTGRRVIRGDEGAVFVSSSVPSASRAAAPRGAGGHPSCQGAFARPRPSRQVGTLLLGHRAPLHPRTRGARTVARCRAGVAVMELLHPSPSLSPFLGCGVLGAEQIFWRPPDNSALYLPPNPPPPVPPNTLVSAAALCCKFPWSNYVLIYDNPGRAVEEGKRQSSLEVACWGLGSPVAPGDRELLHLGAKPGDGESVPKRGPRLSPGGTGE